MKRFKDTPYFVSEDGCVFREGASNPLKAENLKKGYKRVTLSMDGKTVRYAVHRMVGEVYIPNPENKPFINHIDNNPSNNSVENLEWCNQSENMLHCVKHGRCSISKAGKIQSEIFKKEAHEKFSKMLGDRFVGIVNKNPSNYIEFKCFDCDATYQSRIDSNTFKREKPVCRKCSYKYR